MIHFNVFASYSRFSKLERIDQVKRNLVMINFFEVQMSFQKGRIESFSRSDENSER